MFTVIRQTVCVHLYLNVSTFSNTLPLGTSDLSLCETTESFYCRYRYQGRILLLLERNNLQFKPKKFILGKERASMYASNRI